MVGVKSGNNNKAKREGRKQVGLLSLFLAYILFAQCRNVNPIPTGTAGYEEPDQSIG